MYPAFVNCTTIDWFSEWPADALLEVADKYLLETSLGSDEEVIHHSLKKCISVLKLLIFLYLESSIYNLSQLGKVQFSSFNLHQLLLMIVILYLQNIIFSSPQTRQKRLNW